MKLRIYKNHKYFSIINSIFIPSNSGTLRYINGNIMKICIGQCDYVLQGTYQLKFD